MGYCVKKGIEMLMKNLCERGKKKEAGIDGILVTVGLCLIALVLCFIMRDSLSTFIETVVSTMTQKANEILIGNSVIL